MVFAGFGLGAAGAGLAFFGALAAAGAGAADDPTSTYPFFVFSATSLSASASALASLGNVLVWVCPFVPMRPKRTVNEEPSTPTSQNFSEVPSESSNRRMAYSTHKTAQASLACDVGR